MGAWLPSRWWWSKNHFSIKGHRAGKNGLTLKFEELGFECWFSHLEPLWLLESYLGSLSLYLQLWNRTAYLISFIMRNVLWYWKKDGTLCLFCKGSIDSCYLITKWWLRDSVILKWIKNRPWPLVPKIFHPPPAYSTNTGSFQGSLSRVYLTKRSNKKILSLCSNPGCLLTIWLRACSKFRRQNVSGIFTGNLEELAQNFF